MVMKQNCIETDLFERSNDQQKCFITVSLNFQVLMLIISQKVGD